MAVIITKFTLLQSSCKLMRFVSIISSYIYIIQLAFIDLSLHLTGPTYKVWNWHYFIFFIMQYACNCISVMLLLFSVCICPMNSQCLFNGILTVFSSTSSQEYTLYSSAPVLPLALLKFQNCLNSEQIYHNSSGWLTCLSSFAAYELITYVWLLLVCYCYSILQIFLTGYIFKRLPV